jgi:hypothetical protein
MLHPGEHRERLVLFTKARLKARVGQLLVGCDRSLGIEKESVARIELDLAGVIGDFHRGPIYRSGSDLLGLYPRGCEIRNTRQLTLVSEEELVEIAARMGIPALKPEWLGANIVTSGIPSLTLIPPSTRLQFSSGATLVVDLENEPCRQVAAVIAKHHPNEASSFVAAARHKRGVAAWVEHGGAVEVGDEIAVWLPPQRHYELSQSSGRGGAQGGDKHLGRCGIDIGGAGGHIARVTAASLRIA